jgi:hypothetical protein
MSYYGFVGADFGGYGGGMGGGFGGYRNPYGGMGGPRGMSEFGGMRSTTGMDMGRGYDGFEDDCDDDSFYSSSYGDMDGLGGMGGRGMGIGGVRIGRRPWSNRFPSFSAPSLYSRSYAETLPFYYDNYDGTYSDRPPGRLTAENLRDVPEGVWDANYGEWVDAGREPRIGADANFVRYGEGEELDDYYDYY